MYVYTKFWIDDQANVTGNMNLLGWIYWLFVTNWKVQAFHEHTFSHTLFNLYLKENDQVSADFTSN